MQRLNSATVKPWHHYLDHASRGRRFRRDASPARSSTSPMRPSDDSSHGSISGFLRRHSRSPSPVPHGGRPSSVRRSMSWMTSITGGRDSSSVESGRSPSSSTMRLFMHGDAGEDLEMSDHGEAGEPRKRKDSKEIRRVSWHSRLEHITHVERHPRELSDDEEQSPPSEHRRKWIAGRRGRDDLQDGETANPDEANPDTPGDEPGKDRLHEGTSSEASTNDEPVPRTLARRPKMRRQSRRNSFPDEEGADAHEAHRGGGSLSPEREHGYESTSSVTSAASSTFSAYHIREEDYEEPASERTPGTEDDERHEPVGARQRSKSDGHSSSERELGESTVSDRESTFSTWNEDAPEPERLSRAMTIQSINQVKFNKLKKGTLLGEGGFGRVYEGTYFGQKVAVKYLNTDELGQESLEEIQREAQLHYQLRHTNIVDLLCYNTDRTAGPLCMVMNLLVCSVYDLLHEEQVPKGLDPPPRRPLTITQRVSILEDTAQGMAMLHGNDILHLDVKTMNMMLTERCRVQIADFGLSQVKSEVLNKQSPFGLAIGSLPWMAPELLREEPPTFASDVFSFYVVIWELMTASIPHENRSPQQIIRYMSRNKRLKLPENTSDMVIPEKIRELADRCGAQDPKDRPTFESIVSVLTEVLDSIPIMQRRSTGAPAGAIALGGSSSPTSASSQASSASAVSEEATAAAIKELSAPDTPSTASGGPSALTPRGGRIVQALFGRRSFNNPPEGTCAEGSEAAKTPEARPTASDGGVAEAGREDHSDRSSPALEEHPAIEDLLAELDMDGEHKLEALPMQVRQEILLQRINDLARKENDARKAHTDLAQSLEVLRTRYNEVSEVFLPSTGWEKERESRPEALLDMASAPPRAADEHRLKFSKTLRAVRRVQLRFGRRENYFGILLVGEDGQSVPGTGTEHSLVTFRELHARLVRDCPDLLGVAFPKVHRRLIMGLPLSHQQLDEIRKGLEHWLQVVIEAHATLPTPSIILLVRFCSPRHRIRRSRKHFRRMKGAHLTGPSFEEPPPSLDLANIRDTLRLPEAVRAASRHREGEPVGAKKEVVEGTAGAMGGAVEEPGHEPSSPSEELRVSLGSAATGAGGSGGEADDATTGADDEHSLASRSPVDGSEDGHIDPAAPDELEAGEEPETNKFGHAASMRRGAGQEEEEETESDEDEECPGRRAKTSLESQGSTVSLADGTHMTLPGRGHVSRVQHVSSFVRNVAMAADADAAIATLGSDESADEQEHCARSGQYNQEEELMEGDDEEDDEMAKIAAELERVEEVEEQNRRSEVARKSSSSMSLRRSSAPSPGDLGARPPTMAIPFSASSDSMRADRDSIMSVDIGDALRAAREQTSFVVGRRALVLAKAMQMLDRVNPQLQHLERQWQDATSESQTPSSASSMSSTVSQVALASWHEFLSALELVGFVVSYELAHELDELYPFINVIRDANDSASQPHQFKYRRSSLRSSLPGSSTTSSGFSTRSHSSAASAGGHDRPTPPRSSAVRFFERQVSSGADIPPPVLEGDEEEPRSSASTGPRSPAEDAAAEEPLEEDAEEEDARGAASAREGGGLKGILRPPRLPFLPRSGSPPRRPKTAPPPPPPTSTASPTVPARARSRGIRSSMEKLMRRPPSSSSLDGDVTQSPEEAASRSWRSVLSSLGFATSGNQEHVTIDVNFDALVYTLLPVLPYLVQESSIQSPFDAHKTATVVIDMLNASSANSSQEVHASTKVIKILRGHSTG